VQRIEVLRVILPLDPVANPGRWSGMKFSKSGTVSIVAVD